MSKAQKVQLKRSDIPRVRQELLEQQGGKCLICQRDLTKLPSRDVCCDHNHQTWMVRATLCRQCNILESKFMRYFIRSGAKNKGIDYIKFLRGLIKFQKVKDTKYIYPLKTKRRLTK